MQQIVVLGLGMTLLAVILVGIGGWVSSGMARRRAVQRPPNKPTPYLLSASLVGNDYKLACYFQTLCAARKEAQSLASHPEVREVAIYRGGEGGERI